MSFIKKEITSDEKQIIEKIKGMSINKNVSFKHSIYGVIKSGGYKGKEVEIREYYPPKYEVMVDKRGYISVGKNMKVGDKIMDCEIISEVEKSGDIYKYLVSCKKTVLFSKKNIKINGDKVTIIRGEMKGEIGKLVNEHKGKLLVNFDAEGARIMRFMEIDDIFYTDILLKSGKYFQVNRIELDREKKYKIYGEELGGKSKVISMSDIKKMMPGMDIIGDKKVVEDKIGEEVEYISEDISEDTNEEGSEEGSEDEIYDTIEETRPSYKDIERTEIITQQLNFIQRGYYDMIKMILDINGESIDNINAYEIIDNIDVVVNKLNKMIKNTNINFDISGSKIDMKILVSLLVAYEIQKGELIFEGYQNYIKNLFDRNFFYTTLDELMVSFLLRKDNTIFKCDNKVLREFYKSKRYYNIIENIVLCFNDVLRTILDIPMDLKTMKSSVVDIERVERIEKDKKRLITIEDILRDQIVIDAKRILWSPEGEKVVNDFKDLLMKSSKTVDGEMKMEVDVKRISILEDKRGLYKYVYDNLDVAPMVLHKIGGKLMNVLSDRFTGFEMEYKECMGKIMCVDKIIRKYLEIFFDKKGKVKVVTDEEYLDMKRYYELSRIFDRLINRINEKIRKPKEELKEKKIKEKGLEKERVLESRKRVIKRIEGVDELLENFEDITLSSDSGIKRIRI
jgi:hypothetical protein